MQRLLIALLVLLVPAIAIAKPKIAVTPVIGDDDGEVATAIADLLSESAKVTSPKDTKKGMDKLDLSGELTKADGKKLAGNLKVDAVVQGKIEKDGKKKKLVLTTFQYKGGKGEQTFAYKSVDSIGKHKDDVVAAIADVEANQHDKSDKGDKGDGDGDKGDKGDKGDGDGERKPKRSRVSEGDGDGDGDGDGETKVRRRRKGGDDDDKPGRALGPALMVHAGGSFGLRRLTYDSTSMTPPPPTGTVAPGARVEVELYPMAFGGKTGGAAGLGIVGDFDRAVGLSINIPGTQNAVPITQQHFSIGARYRTAVGAAAWVGFGASYVGRMYEANRTGLADPQALDTPDVNYQAVAPHIAFGTPIASSATFFAELRPMLILSAGKIATKDQYGSGTAYGADARAGIDIALGGSFGLRFVGEYNQVSLSFKGGTQSPTQRGVTGATDRTIALGATLAMTY